MKLRYYSLRIKLDDVILNEDFEKKVLENIRYCRKLVGEQFRVIFWNESLTDKQCEEFVKRNEHLLFEVNTKITKRFEPVWFLIDSKNEKSSWRYMSEGDITSGIVKYLNMVTHMMNTRES